MYDDFYDYGFVVDWMCKDLVICFEEVKLNGFELFIVKMVD